MPETRIPGLKAIHAIVTPTCRENRSSSGAFDEAVLRLRREYDAILEMRDDEPTFHVVLTVDGEGAV